MPIISSENSITQCGLQLPEVYDVIEIMYVLRTGHFFVTLSSVFWNINLYPAIKVSHTTGYFGLVLSKIFVAYVRQLNTIFVFI